MKTAKMLLVIWMAYIATLSIFVIVPFVAIMIEPQVFDTMFTGIMFIGSGVIFYTMARGY